MQEKEQNHDVIDQVWKNTKPGVEVAGALLSPLAKRVSKTLMIFARSQMQKRLRK